MKRNLLSLKIFYFSLIVLMSLLIGAGNSVQGQVTIVSDGLNSSTSLFTLTNGAYYTGNSATGDRPASSPFAIEGTHGRGATNTTATLTSNSNINTSNYSNITLSLRLAAFSIGATNQGVDATDYVRVEISPNSGTTWYNTVQVVGNNNAYWAYSTGTGNASTPYDGNTTTVQFAPGGGGNRTTDGYSTITITSLPATSTLRVRITITNNRADERWVIDDFKITGITSTPFWFKGDGATAFNGTTWNDETTNNINAVRSSGTFSLVSNSVNYNPSVSFSNANQQMLTNVSSLIKSFVVVTIPTSTTDLAGLIGDGSDKGIRLSNDAPDGIEDASWRGDNNADDWYSGGGSRINGNSNSFLHSFKWHIVNQTRGTALNSQFYLGGYFSGRSYSGNIAEVMAFTGDVPNQNFVESYLAIKYGISLPDNYYASDGTATWTLVSGYQNDVHGIGRDDTYGLNQLSSKSENPGTDIIIIQSGSSFTTPTNAQTGTAISNQQFLITGHNNGTTTAFSTLSTGINILGRKWNAQATNSLPTESFLFNLTGTTIPTPYCKIGVLVADDAAFTTNLRFVEGIFTSPNLTVNNVALTNNKYFTVAQLLTPAAGAIAGTQTICNGTAPATISSTTDGTGFGTVSYLWESSTDGLTWNPIIGATNNTYSPGTSTQSTQYRRTTVATLGTVTCNSTSSTPVIVTVRPAFTAGTISNTSQTICSGTVPTTQIGSTTAASGGDNTITYQWQYSTDNTFATGVTTVANNTATYTPTQTLTQTTYYRRQAHDGTCNTSFTSSSNIWTVTVRPVFTAGTISNTGQTICSGTVPTTQIGSTTAASGGDNTITYQWQYSTDNTFATGVTTVASNTATYTPTQTLTQTTYYRRQAHDGTCNTSFSTSTNTWTVTVRPVFTAGTISNTGQTICSGTIPTTQIGSTTAASGGDNTITYQWQYSTDNTFATGVTTVANNTATYTPTQTLTQTTYYRRQAHDGTCNTSFSTSTNTWTVTVRPVFTAGTISNTGQTICSGTIPTTQIGSTTAASGGDNTITYQWQYSTDNTFATGVTTVANNTATYTPTQTLTQTTYYRRQAHDGTCNTSFTTSTNTWTVTVRPVFTAGTISNTGQTICSGTIPTTQIGSTTAASGGDNTITYQWQYSTDNTFATGVTTVANNTATYTPTQTLTQTTYYRRQAHDGTCNTSFTSSSNNWTVTVNPLPSITTQPSDLILCEGESGSFTVATSASSPTYQWGYATSPTPASWIEVPEGGDISGSETNVLSIANTLVGYSGVYVSCLITANGCETRSGAVLLTVNPLPVTGEIIPD